jgi:hypothetical protein
LKFIITYQEAECCQESQSQECLHCCHRRTTQKRSISPIYTQNLFL